MTARQKRAIDFARRELLSMVEYHGLEAVFEKDGASNEHWPRGLACEVLRVFAGGRRHADELALRDLCWWLSDRLYEIHGRDCGPDIERAIGRLDCRFIEYRQDRRRMQSASARRAG